MSRFTRSLPFVLGLPVAFGLVSATPALAETTPLTLESTLPVGFMAGKKYVIGVEQDVRGSATSTSVVAYSVKKWKKSKFAVPKLVVDSADPDPVAADKAAVKTAELNAILEANGIVETEQLPGHRTGRFRQADWGLVVYFEDDKVIARVGDATDIHTQPIVSDFGKLGGKCVGTRTNELLNVVAFTEYKSVAVVVQTSCAPTDAAHPTTRVRRVLMADMSKLLQG